MGYTALEDKSRCGCRVHVIDTDKEMIKKVRDLVRYDRPREVERIANTSCISHHYENMPIQINWKFYRQKMKFFR